MTSMTAANACRSDTNQRRNDPSVGAREESRIESEIRPAYLLV